MLMLYGRPGLQYITSSIRTANGMYGDHYDEAYSLLNISTKDRAGPCRNVQADDPDGPPV